MVGQGAIGRRVRWPDVNDVAVRADEPGDCRNARAWALIDLQLVSSNTPWKGVSSSRRLRSARGNRLGWEAVHPRSGEARVEP
jgi:hypothetical protein